MKCKIVQKKFDYGYQKTDFQVNISNWIEGEKVEKT
jgi:hypothetical protein